MVRVAIVGGRNCANTEKSRIIAKIPQGCTRIISGGARGIDTLVEEIARERGIPFVKILPDYEKYGRNAPLVRNKLIVKEADLVLAFWDFSSRGTASTIAACIEMGVPVEIVGLEK